MVYAVSERPAVGLSGPMADPEVLSSEDTAKSRLALYNWLPRVFVGLGVSSIWYLRAPSWWPSWRWAAPL